LNLTTPDQKAQAGGGIKINADERTNSILLIGGRAERLKYRAIIADLDSPVESGGNTHVVYLRYADAQNVAAILTEVAQAMMKMEGKNVSVAGGAAGATGGSVNVQADEETNALVISASAAVFPSLRSVIQKLDIPRAQVHVEAIIAEVSLDTAKELGVQWGAYDKGTGVLATRFPNEPSPESLADIVSGALTGIPTGLTLGLGSISDSGLSIATIIRALEGDGETNLLSTPSIVTLDNQEAEIIVGQNVPFVTGESTSDVSDTDNPFRTIEREDIGITLKVTPQINEGDAITLEIYQEVSAIAASSAGAVDIVTTKRAISTTVQLEDEQMLVLGGLIDDAYTDSEQKVPLLGDIPIIGALFRSTRTQKVKRNLMVFIRATIIKDPAKARTLSINKYNFMRDIQLQENEGGDYMGPVLVPYE
jgi:general secretion pathway protein D